MVDEVIAPGSIISTSLEGFFDGLPSEVGLAVRIIIWAIIIVLLSVFIWFFYKSFAKKDLISLNLQKYNTVNHPGIRKLFALFFYFIEYLIVAPLVILVWFVALAIFVLVVAELQSIEEILLITSVLVIAIRILAYTKRSLAQELAKLFPLITLAVFLISPQISSIGKISMQISSIPLLLGSIVYFLITIVVVEVILRLMNEAVDFWQSERYV